MRFPKGGNPGGVDEESARFSANEDQVDVRVRPRIATGVRANDRQAEDVVAQLSPPSDVVKQGCGVGLQG